MENNINSLKDLAINSANNADPIHQDPPEDRSKTEIPTAEELAGFPTPSINTMYYASVEKVGDTPVIIGNVNKSSKSNKPDDATAKIMNTPVPSMVGLEEDTLNSPSGASIPNFGNKEITEISPQDNALILEVMPDIDENKRIEIARPILESRSGIIKDLILNMGFTPEEANIAATNQIRKKLTEAYELEKEKPTENIEKPEDVGIVTIDKTSDPNDLGLTKEEHEKLEKVKRVRLVLVEDMDLANIKIERPAEEHKIDYVMSIEGSISKYSVPMPMLGDFVSFKGAQMLQMANAVQYEDATMDEIINTKSSLIYDKFIGGSVVKKYDPEGKIIMSYNEFVNKFPYHDIDLALYGILCASSMEENTTSIKCPKCSHEYMQKYNLKSLLKLDDLPDNFKQRIDDILKYKNDPVEMKKIYDEKRKARRYRSPFTGNIYDISYPSIARAISLLKRMQSADQYTTYISAIAMYISRILIYNSAKDTYVEVTADEVDNLLDVLKAISNDDIKMLGTQITEDLMYKPKFELRMQCPSCGYVRNLEISIEELIFVVAQDSMVEISN